jgi:sphingolipid 4-desaturase/C4-monooxygenase
MPPIDYRMLSPYDYHDKRRREIIAAHPEVRDLIGPHPATALWVVPGIAVQVAMAFVMSSQPWWLVPIAAYLIGGFAMHLLNCLIHETVHDLVFRRPALNKALGLLANLVAGMPTAIAFRHFHRLHHRHLGICAHDPDTPPEWEARLIGHGPVGKLIWMVLQPLTYGMLHPLLVETRIKFDFWLIANAATSLAVAALVYWFLGGASLVYLLLSTYFAVGFHPAGAHILQEHVNFSGSYPTASYYGPMNRIGINLGLHVEHHDFPGIAAARLPALHRIAPAHYDTLFSHRSRIATLWHFLFDRAVGIETRYMRGQI